MTEYQRWSPARQFTRSVVDSASAKAVRLRLVVRGAGLALLGFAPLEFPKIAGRVLVLLAGELTHGHTLRIVLVGLDCSISA